MTVVSIAEAWPAAGHPFTVGELDRMPDEGRRHELLDGVLIVTPRPAKPHAEVVAELGRSRAHSGSRTQAVRPAK